MDRSPWHVHLGRISGCGGNESCHHRGANFEAARDLRSPRALRAFRAHRATMFRRGSATRRCARASYASTACSTWSLHRPARGPMPRAERPSRCTPRSPRCRRTCSCGSRFRRRSRCGTHRRPPPAARRPSRCRLVQRDDAGARRADGAGARPARARVAHVGPDQVLGGKRGRARHVAGGRDARFERARERRRAHEPPALRERRRMADAIARGVRDAVRILRRRD